MDPVDSPTATTGPFPPPWLVLIGASGSDGLRQMIELLEHLPARLPAAVLLVLHRPPDKPSHLPEILRRARRLPVCEPRQGEPLFAGACYLGAPDAHLRVSSGPLADLVPHHL